jgi:putative transposase
MKKSKNSEAHMATSLRQVEAGAPIAKVTRQLGVSEQTSYLWRKKSGQMGVAEIRPLGLLKKIPKTQATGDGPDPELLKKSFEAWTPRDARAPIGGEIAISTRRASRRAQFLERGYDDDRK